MSVAGVLKIILKALLAAQLLFNQILHTHACQHILATGMHNSLFDKQSLFLFEAK